MVDFTTYQPPGVFIEEAVAPTVTVVGVTPSVVAIVGPSVGYRTFTEAVTLTGTTASLLAKAGINVSVVTVKAADGTTYAPASYSLTIAAGPDGNITTTGDNTTSLARNGATIPDGSTVYVTYRYTDTAFLSPTRLRDYDDIVDRFGPAQDLNTGTIVSPLTLAAKKAKENGAGEVVLVATPNATVTRADLTAGYAKLDSITDIDIVVALPVGITGTTATPGDTANVGLDLKAYVEASSALGNLRVGFIGLESTVTVDPATTAAAFRSKRVVFAGAPSSLNYFNSVLNTNITVAGYYLAAALAGIAASQPAQVPLTRKQIRGFAGIPAVFLSTMSLTQKNTWSDQGVLVAEVNRAGDLIVRHGTTTDRTNVQTREVSLVRAKDKLVGLLTDTFESAGLIGGFIDDTTNVRIQGVVTGCLETALRSELIVGYSGVKVRIRPGNPQVVEVKFQYQPAYPLNYIVVSFSINTVTGETTALDAAA